jgi:hypothetical protein
MKSHCATGQSSSRRISARETGPSTKLKRSTGESRSDFTRLHVCRTACFRLESRGVVESVGREVAVTAQEVFSGLS